MALAQEWLGLLRHGSLPNGRGLIRHLVPFSHQIGDPLAGQRRQGDGRSGPRHPRHVRIIVVKVRLCPRIRHGTYPRALDLLPPHSHGEVATAGKKELVVVRARVQAPRDPFEAPEIQLASEGEELCLLEEPGQDLGCEDLGLLDDEGAAVGHPVDDGGEVSAVEDLHEFSRKGHQDSAPLSLRLNHGECHLARRFLAAAAHACCRQEAQVVLVDVLVIRVGVVDILLLGKPRNGYVRSHRRLWTGGGCRRRRRVGRLVRLCLRRRLLRAHIARRGSRRRCKSDRAQQRRIFDGGR
mmetsp:Transcript_23151/g.55855  ORF Transcript_23151/g.55855 Transcript_23151/m.55855 type:complete len:296 (+) Transcript_23151:246-1133(+)